MIIVAGAEGVCVVVKAGKGCAAVDGCCEEEGAAGAEGLLRYVL